MALRWPQTDWWRHSATDQTLILATIGRRLRENHFFGGFARNRPMISEKNRKLRLDLARKYVNMPKILWRWEQVLINSKRGVRLYKRRGEGRILATNNPTVKHSKSVMVWGCVSGHGIWKLAQISTRMTGPVYVDILSNNLISLAEGMGPKDNFIFQQDNDPKHNSKVATKWLSDNHVDGIVWSPQNPDWTYISNLWDYCDRNITKTERKDIYVFRKAVF